MEAFKKTLQNFREVVYQLTGFRIDVLADQKYRLLPLYAETSQDTLLFQKTGSGEINMLESEFYLQLGELMELHLERQNSIPMFLAGLMKMLWRRQNHEEEEEMEKGEREEEEGSGSEGEVSSQCLLGANGRVFKHGLAGTGDEVCHTENVNMRRTGLAPGQWCPGDCRGHCRGESPDT